MRFTGSTRNPVTRSHWAHAMAERAFQDSLFLMGANVFRDCGSVL